MYEQFAAELATIQTRRFHVTHMLPPDPRVVDELAWPCAAPAGYVAFIARFGAAFLFRELDYYLIRVFASPRPGMGPQGEALLGFGGFDVGEAYFEQASLEANGESPVYETRGESQLIRTAANFEEWFERCVRVARRRYGRREWRAIVAGPAPFSAEELAIIRARALYSWRLVGPAANGELIFEVSNHSDRVLPYLSIGVTAPRLQGGIWLPVADLQPGSTRRIQRAVYKGLVDPEEVLALPLPDPEPEDRERYWEFKTSTAVPRPGPADLA